MTICNCDKCRAACERIPGLFTPREAERAIAAGHGDRMMAVFIYDRRGGFQTLTPISNPKEYERTAISPRLRLGTKAARGRCTFYTDDGRCELHGTDHKPAECAETLTCQPDANPGVNNAIRDLWSHADGRRVVAEWKRKYDPEHEH